MFFLTKIRGALESAQHKARNKMYINIISQSHRVYCGSFLLFFFFLQYSSVWRYYGVNFARMWCRRLTGCEKSVAHIMLLYYKTNVANDRVLHYRKLIIWLHLTIQDSRLLSDLIREIKTWLSINHITVHNNTSCIF